MKTRLNPRPDSSAHRRPIGVLAVKAVGLRHQKQRPKSQLHRFGMAASKHTHAANPKPLSFHQPQTAHPNTLRKPISPGVPEVLRSCPFGRGYVQPRNAKNAGEFLKILTMFALLVGVGFLLPRSLRSLRGRVGSKPSGSGSKPSGSDLFSNHWLRAKSVGVEQSQLGSDKFSQTFAILKTEQTLAKLFTQISQPFF